MMQIAVFAIALVVVFAIKAIAIMKTHDELVANDASFSWMSARQQDEQLAAQWSVEEPDTNVSSATVTLGGMRRVGPRRRELMWGGVW